MSVFLRGTIRRMGGMRAGLCCVAMGLPSGFWVVRQYCATLRLAGLPACRRGGIGAFLTLVLCAFLVGCAGQAPLPPPPSTLSATLVSDAQHCLSRAECTTKLSRTLLFVFDYAAAGAPLVQREGRLLYTPAGAPVTDWPALYIRLAEAEQSAFAFNAQCRAQACRLTVEQVLQIYRSYLADKPCAFNAALCRFD